MILKIFKILFIFLLIALQVSCAAEDMDDNGNSGSLPGADMGIEDDNINAFVIDQQWWSFDYGSVGDTLNHEKDTLKEFPTQKCFTESSMSYIFGLQSLASDVVSLLRNIVAHNESDQWMNFYSPYLGAFVSVSDSRVKQWQLETDAIFEDIKWPYHLLISDLPDGTMTGKNNKALEIYYDYDFKNGVMFFSPCHFNPVRYPEKVMSRDMKCKLYFSASGDEVENTLYVSDFGYHRQPDSFGNLYLNTILQGNTVSFSAIVDMPYLWFDKVDNPGYSVVMLGGIDCLSANTAVISCVCPNTESNVISDVFVKREGVDVRMAEYLRLWNITRGAADGDSLSVSYQTPAFMQAGTYVGAGREVEDRAVFAKALSKANETVVRQFGISPLKVSILNIEW